MGGVKRGSRRPGWKIPNGMFATETPQLTDVSVYAPADLGQQNLEEGEPKNTRFPRDVLCAETKNGETFFFYGDMFSLHLLIMMGDALENCLKEERGYYQHPDRRSSKYY